jgi:hypothetical protein
MTVTDPDGDSVSLSVDSITQDEPSRTKEVLANINGYNHGSKCLDPDA